MKNTLTRIDNLLDLFVDQLKYMYSIEEQIIAALPEVIRAAENKDLREGIQNHLEETKEQSRRLHKIFKLLKLPQPTEEHCGVTEQLIASCQESIASIPKSPLRDAAIILKAQLIEHHEISMYGTLCTFAKELGLDEVADLLHDSFKEEVNADKKLSKVAEGGFLTSGVNKKAIKDNS